MWEKLQNLDKKVFYLLLTLAIAVPIVNPLGMPIRIEPMVQTAFDTIQKLPDGGYVVIGYDYEPGNEIDLNPQVTAMFHQFAAKKMKLVLVSSFPTTPVFIEQTTVVLEKQYGYRYGVDYVNLGYYAGGEATFTEFLKNPTKIFPKEYRGGNTSDLEIIKNLKEPKQFVLGITLNDGPANGITIAEFIRQVNMTYGIPVLVGCTPVMGAPNMPYVQSKQALGIVLGLSGAAQYELLTQHPGPGVRGMDSQSVAHMLIIFFVILGNIGYFVQKNQEKAAKGGAGK
jgi:hypothetical protein